MNVRHRVARHLGIGVAGFWLLSATGMAGIMLLPGCDKIEELTTKVKDEAKDANNDNADPATATGGGSDEPIDLSKVTWVHGSGIGDWPVTAKLGSVTFQRGAYVCSDGMSWPSNWAKIGTKGVSANHVVLANIGGRWYGGAWEAMNPDIARCRPMETITKNQPQYGPFGQVEQDPFWQWRPKKGEKIGFMITSWIRSGVKKPVGRSHVVMTEWPY